MVYIKILKKFNQIYHRKLVLVLFRDLGSRRVRQACIPCNRCRCNFPVCLYIYQNHHKPPQSPHTHSHLGGHRFNMPIFTKFHKSKHTKLDNVQQFYFLYVFFKSCLHSRQQTNSHVYIYKVKNSKKCRYVVHSSPEIQTLVSCH